LKPVTNWVIADLSIKEGRALVMAALKQMVTMSVCNNRYCSFRSILCLNNYLMPLLIHGMPL